MHVAAPAQRAGVDEHPLGSDPVDDVWMRADPQPPGGSVAQDGVESGAVTILAERVDPHQSPVRASQGLGDLAGTVVGVCDRLDVQPHVVEGIKYRGQARAR